MPELAIGVVLIVGGAFGAAWLASNGSTDVTIVASARALNAGHTLLASDLKAINVDSRSAEFFVHADDAKELLGRTLLVPLAPSAPIGFNVVMQVEPLRDGEILAPLLLSAGDFPPELAPGDSVRLALVPDPSLASKVEPETYKGVAEVWALDPPTDTEPNYVVTLRTSDDFLLPAAGATRAKLVILPEAK